MDVLVLSLVTNPVTMSLPRSAREEVDDEVCRGPRPCPSISPSLLITFLLSPVNQIAGRPKKEVLKEEASHLEVLEVGRKKAGDMGRLVEEIVKQLAPAPA